MIEFETMGTYIKVGEVSVNLGEILNEKRYRVVNAYPLAKCYDKAAKVKLAVDFVPEGGKGGGERNVRFASNVQQVGNTTNITRTNNTTTKQTALTTSKPLLP